MPRVSVLPFHGACVRLRGAQDVSGDGQAHLMIDLNLPNQDEFGQYVRRALTQ